MSRYLQRVSISGAGALAGTSLVLLFTRAVLNHKPLSAWPQRVLIIAGSVGLLALLFLIFGRSIKPTPGVRPAANHAALARRGCARR
jgi:hypothetical protein